MALCDFPFFTTNCVSSSLVSVISIVYHAGCAKRDALLCSLSYLMKSAFNVGGILWQPFVQFMQYISIPQWMHIFLSFDTCNRSTELSLTQLKIYLFKNCSFFKPSYKFQRINYNIIHFRNIVNLLNFYYTICIYRSWESEVYYIFLFLLKNI